MHKLLQNVSKLHIHYVYIPHTQSKYELNTFPYSIPALSKGNKIMFCLWNNKSILVTSIFRIRMKLLDIRPHDAPGIFPVDSWVPE